MSEAMASPLAERHSKEQQGASNILESAFPRFGPFVTVNVGRKFFQSWQFRCEQRTPEEYETFYIYEKLACRSSGFFRAACNRYWKEGATRVIELPEDDPNIFALFVQWMFTGEYNKTDSSGPLFPCVILAVDVYILADKLDVPPLKDRAIDHIELICSKAPWFSLTYHSIIDKIYGNTPEGSPLRRLAVSQQINNSMKGGSEPKWLREGSPRPGSPVSDFYFDLACEKFRLTLRKMRLGDDQSIPTAGPCEFHVHGKEEYCKARDGATRKET
ncbi:MAG: hypothetical protein M1820_010862 [Bogoriella megaspora]|nr:MAG: hypothetical protein M1820_010862 [Bogoriella megaspora]